MGLFSSIKENLNEAKRIDNIVKEKEKAEKEKDPSRPDIKNLNYTRLDPSIADKPEMINAKCGMMNKKYKQQFLDCIKEGKVEYAEAVAIGNLKKVIGSIEHKKMFKEDETEYIYRYYLKVADLNGVVCKDMIAAVSYIIFDDNYNPLTGILDADNPDNVDPEKHVHIYILHYFLGNKEFYAAIRDNEFEDLSKIADKVYIKETCFENYIYYWN